MALDSTWSHLVIAHLVGEPDRFTPDAQGSSGHNENGNILCGVGQNAQGAVLAPHAAIRNARTINLKWASASASFQGYLAI